MARASWAKTAGIARERARMPFERARTHRYSSLPPFARPRLEESMVPDPNEPPARQSRLIVPGAEPEPVERPRIILPPGASTSTHDDLPEYPRLRAVQLTPVRDGERE